MMDLNSIAAFHGYMLSKNIEMSLYSDIIMTS